MVHWLCITNEKNWNVAKNKRIWGLAKKEKKLGDLGIGDYLVFYIKQRKEKDEIVKPKIAGIFKVASKPFYDKEKIFATSQKRYELYPWRFKIETVAIPENPLEFRRLIPKLEFIKKKRKWYVYLQQAMIKIPKSDFDVIKSAI